MDVGFIGAGHIARALGQGWSRPGLEDAPGLRYFDVSRSAAEATAQAMGADVAPDLLGLVERSELVIVAVRPQQVQDVLTETAPLLGPRALVSVAAGVPLADLRAALPDGARVGRVMPNVAAALGLGVFLFVPGTLGPRAAAVEELFARAGEVVALDEGDFDAATAVAGCMPGVLAALVRDLARADRQQRIEDVLTATGVSVVDCAIGVDEIHPLTIHIAHNSSANQCPFIIHLLEKCQQT